MVSSQTNDVARRFARRAAQHLAARYGPDEARARMAKRVSEVDADERRLFADILAALDELQTGTPEAEG